MVEATERIVKTFINRVSKAGGSTSEPEGVTKETETIENEINVTLWIGR